MPIVSLARMSARRESSVERMRSSLKIASISGIEVRIDITFLLFVAWIWFSYYQIAGASGATQGVLLTLALFGCVLLHEFGHAFAARAFGIQTPDITLLPIGGVARLSRIPDEPWQELVIAVAGPLVNVVIAAALAAVLVFVVRETTPLDRLESIENPRIELLAQLLYVNVVLALFNLIPAFPMDGGRVLRAILAMAMPYTRATMVAARVGQVLAICLAAYSYFGPTKNPILIFIAIFIFFGAQREAAMARMRQTPPPP